MFAQSCEAFAKRCPGANMQCSEFSAEGCVEYKYLSARAFQIAHVWGTSTTITGCVARTTRRTKDLCPGF